MRYLFAEDLFMLFRHNNVNEKSNEMKMPIKCNEKLVLEMFFDFSILYVWKLVFTVFLLNVTIK